MKWNIVSGNVGLYLKTKPKFFDENFAVQNSLVLGINSMKYNEIT